MVKTQEISKNTSKNTVLSKSASAASNKSADGKLQVVEEKPTKPPGVPKFSRRAGQGDQNEIAPTPIDKQNSVAICQQMLMDGYVQSYVDFYHLTHRHEIRPPGDDNVNAPMYAVGDPNSIIIVNIPPEELLFMRDNLVQAEVARRQGDTSNVYVAYNKLADHYVKQKDWKTGFFFHEKCLEVAQLTNDIRAEMSANHSLGVINQLMHNFDRARVHHEKHESLAVSVDVFEEIARANAELYKVYLVLAEKLEMEGMIDEALDMYNKCLEASKKCWDKSAEAESNGRIGSLLLNRGQLQECIPYLREQSHLAADLGNPESRCRACTALALAYDLLGQSEKALNELQLVHTISEQSGDQYLQAQACKALGTLYSKVGRLDAAVDILQRHFALLKAIVYRPANQPNKPPSELDPAKKITTMDLDLARAFIGISKGNQLLGTYVVAIEYDLTALLDWKLNRTDLHKAHAPTTTSFAVATEETQPTGAVEEEEAQESAAEVKAASGQASARKNDTTGDEE